MIARLTPRAETDLDAIRNYLIPRSQQGAEHVRVAIAETIGLLEQFPRCGRETDIEDVRVLPVVRYPYLIYHLASAEELVIVHIRHASRSAAAAADFRP